jgi:hypothetical protein
MKYEAEAKALEKIIVGELGQANWLHYGNGCADCRSVHQESKE